MLPLHQESLESFTRLNIGNDERGARLYRPEIYHRQYPRYVYLARLVRPGRLVRLVHPPGTCIVLFNISLPQPAFELPGSHHLGRSLERLHHR